MSTLEALPAPACVAAPAPVAPAATAMCLNCGAPLSGPFCAGCGQRSSTGRLNTGELWQEFMGQFLAFDRGLWATMRDLTLDPGRMLCAYLAGQRRRYVSPITYLFFATAVGLLAWHLFPDSGLGYLRAQTTHSLGGNGALSQRQLDAFTRVTFTLSQQMNYLNLLRSVPFALLVCLLFPGRKVNLAETLVASFYSFGHASVLYAALAPLMLAAGGDIQLRVWVSYGIYALVSLRMAWGLFGGGAATAARALLALVLSFVAFSMAMGMVAIAYVLATVH